MEDNKVEDTKKEEKKEKNDANEKAPVWTGFI